jgi:hypothetical protein
VLVCEQGPITAEGDGGVPVGGSTGSPSGASVGREEKRRCTGQIGGGDELDEGQ